MTYKQIEASREARLWITQVIVPTVAVATAVVMGVPSIREAVSEKAKKTIIKFKKRHK
jgi:hypothetical protein